MKKFLAILLIAIIACSNVSVIEEEEFDLEKTVQQIITELKNSGKWNEIMHLLKTVGKIAAYTLCKRYAPASACKIILSL